MKAAVYRKYGEPKVLQIQDVPDPKAGVYDVVVRIHATAVTMGDVRIRKAMFPSGFAPMARLFVFGVFEPRKKILGMCYAGRVESVGKEVTAFAVGDRVSGMTGLSMGAYAEKVAVDSRKAIAKIPASVSFEKAAGVLFGGTAALHYLRKIKLAKGQSILVNGSTGSVGTNAVQLAKIIGARVTAVGNGKYSRLLVSLGADHTIDYRKKPLPVGSHAYDVVLDCVGTITPKIGRSIATKNGMVGLMAANLWHTVFHGKNIVVGPATEQASDMQYLLDLVSKKKLNVVIDGVYGLKDISKAHAHAEGRSKVGNIVVIME